MEPKNTWTCFLIVRANYETNIIGAFQSFEEATKYLEMLPTILRDKLTIKTVPGLRLNLK